MSEPSKNGSNLQTYDVLVTGSSGHLGHALLLSLPSLGYTPLGIGILPPPALPSSCPSQCIVGNIADPTLISSLLTQHPSIKHIVHSATLHKPHVGSHSKADFVDTNITGTLVLLEAVAAAESSSPGRVKSFVFMSTTSAFGSALSTMHTPSSAASASRSAVWIDEQVRSIPKNIYGSTKTAAEDLCHLFHVRHALPTLVLRTSRFFPEADDDEHRRNAMGDANLKVCELTYRRVDVEDVVRAVVCAMEKTRDAGWGRYIISAPPPFVSYPTSRKGAVASDEPGKPAAHERSKEAQSDGEVKSRTDLLRQLANDAPQAIFNAVPRTREVFGQLGWHFLPHLDRVYDSSKAIRELGWQPYWTFERVVDRLGRGESWKSDLTDRIGKKGYHGVPTGVYTTAARGQADVAAPSST